MNDLILSILTNVVWASLGAAGIWLMRFLGNVKPTQRLWRLKDSSKMIICAATSTRTHTGDYIRPATGIGQLRALIYVVRSLKKGYRVIHSNNVLLSDDSLEARIENDIILLGGPKNNEITRIFLDKFQSQSIVEQCMSVIIWRPGINDEERHFEPVSKDGEITRDFGFFLRADNPYSSDGTQVCLLSGGHTYGTIAAARYFTESTVNKRHLLKSIGPVVAGVVSCDVINGYPVNLKLEVGLGF